MADSNSVYRATVIVTSALMPGIVSAHIKLQFIVLFESTQQAAKLPRHCEEGQCPDVAISSNIYR